MTSALELQNADTKRVARDRGSRHLTFAKAGMTRVPLRKAGAQGPEKLIVKKQVSGSTMSITTLKHLLVARELKSGEGAVQMPLSRRKDRLFGSEGPGRTKLLSKGVRVDMLGGGAYDPRKDTCVKSFVAT